MMRTARPRTTLATLAVAVGAALTLTSCGGETITNAQPSASNGTCGSVKLAENPWVGMQASVEVVKYVAETELGCAVEVKKLKEEVSWQGFATGEVDVIIEDWGHPELEQKYVEQEKSAVKVGPNGNEGLIGWFVPKWMAEKYPDITDYRNLDKYADLFETSESGGKGQMLAGDPSFVTYDEALVKNLDLNFSVVYTGSEAALITEFEKATANKTPLLGYFYDPQWKLLDLGLVRVNLPKWDPATCKADKQAAACDYEPTVLTKFARTEFMESGSPAATLVQNFSWTNDDQNTVAKSIAGDKLSGEEAAKKWVEANPEKVQAWIS